MWSLPGAPQGAVDILSTPWQSQTGTVLTPSFTTSPLATTAIMLSCITADHFHGANKSIRHGSSLYPSLRSRTTQLQSHWQRAEVHGTCHRRFCPQSLLGCGVGLSEGELNAGQRSPLPAVALHRQSSIRPHHHGLRMIGRWGESSTRRRLLICYCLPVSGLDEPRISC